MKNRLKEIRSNCNLTQQAFADRLQIARNNIAGYETGKRSPSDAVVSLICREFNVNENWLRTGNGEMYVSLNRQQEIAKLSADLFKTEKESFKSRLIMALAELDDDEWRMLESIAKKIAKKKDQE